LFTLPRIRVYILAGILLLAGITRFPADALRLELLYLFETAAALTFAVFMWRVNMWWALFIALGAFSRTYPYYTQDSYLAFQQILFGAAFFLSVSFIMKRRWESTVYNAICIVALVHAAWGFMQYFGIWILLHPLKGYERDITGLMDNRNTLAGVLALCAPAFWRGQWKFGLVPVVIAMCLARTSLGIISLGAGIVFYGFIKGKIWPSLAITIVAVLGYGFFIDSPGYERWEVWKWGLKIWFNNRIFTGFGLGNWVEMMEYPVYIPGVTSIASWHQAHNEFVQMLFEMGIGFIVLSVGYIISMYRNFREKNILPYTALTILLVQSFFNFPFHIGTTAMLGVFWLGVIQAYHMEKGEKNHAD